MAKHDLGKIEPIRAELKPPAGAVATGEVFVLPNGEQRIVYRAMLRNPDAQVVPVTVDGEAIRRDTPNPNMPGKVIGRVVDPLIEREFILRRTINGQVRYVFNFRPDPKDVLRRAHRDAAKELEKDFFAEAAARGYSGSDLLDNLTGAPPEMDTPDELPSEPQSPAEDEVPQPKVLEEMTKAELVSEMVARGMDPENVVGTGARGRVKNEDLITALRAPPTEGDSGGDTY